MLIVFCLVSGFVAAWFGVALVDFGSYYSIFGKLKFKWISEKMTQNEGLICFDIINDHNMPAWEISEKVNQDVYWHVAKRYKLVYLSMCPYCMACWIHFLNLIICYLFLIEFAILLFPIYIILGISVIYFFLNFVNK